MEEIMSKEHELLSLGGQAAAAAHSLRHSIFYNKNYNLRLIRNNLKITMKLKKILIF